MHIASKTFIVAGALVAAAACGGSSATTTGTGASGSTSSGHPSTSTSGPGGATASSSSGGPSAAQACMDSAHAQCTQRDKCSMNGYLNDLTYGSESACETALAGPCVSALGAKGTGQTPAKIEACVAAYASEACTDYFDGNPAAACVPPAGTLANGTACGASAQCTSTFCAIPQYEVCGTCAALPVAGASCMVQADCGRDLACAGAAAGQAGKCAAWVASGGACLTGTAPCQNGLACVGEVVATMTMGTCGPAGATVGVACDATRKTAASCDGDLGLVCIPTAAGSKGVGTCQAITLVAAGAACGDVGSMPITGFADCEAGGLCKKATMGATTGTCLAPVAAGMACDSDPTIGPICVAPARCVPTTMGMTAGTCTTPDAATCM